MNCLSSKTLEAFFNLRQTTLKKGNAGDFSTLDGVQIQPGSKMDWEVNENKPTILQE